MQGICYEMFPHEAPREQALREDAAMGQVGTLSDCSAIVGPALVMGASPSLKNFGCAAFKGTKIGVGDVPWRAPELGPFDYWVCANTQFPLPWIRRHASAIKKADARTMVYATVMFAGMSKKRAEQAIEKIGSSADLPQGLVYDQRHLDGQFCSPLQACCFSSAKVQVGPPIQERLHNRVPNHPRYVGAHSVAFHAIALAILLGARPIVVAGVDLPELARDYTYIHNHRVPPMKTRRGGLRHRLQRHHSWRVSDNRESVFSPYRNEMLQDLKILAGAAQALGSQIINTSKNSLLREVPAIRSVVYQE